ncbi:hypothetical protein Q7P37_005737 [Cladosporium fusiforme]
MKYTAATLALVAGATAHTLMSEVYVDGAGQGSGTCIRTPKNAKGAVDPIIDLGSKDMACGQDGDKGVARTCPISGGQQLTFEYRQWPDDAPRASIAKGHMGPCAVYLKKVDDATTATASGDGWFKLWDEGLDGSGKWCTNKVTDNNGHLSVTLPDSLPGGDYLVRPELLALHNIPEKHQPEFYVGCAQMFLKSSGSSGPKETVSIPGYVSGEDAGTTYNPFEKPLKDYKVPGPKVYEPSSSGVSVMKSMKQTDGLGEGCIVTNNNWCGKELPDFSNEEGCWKADKDCWAQLDKCYDEAGAVGVEGCKIWQQKCKDNQGTCKSGGSGPANKGKNLDPKKSMIETPASVNGGMDYGSSGSSSGSSSDSDSNSNSDSDNTDYSSDSSSSNDDKSSSSSSPDSYKKKEVKAPSSDNNDSQKQESAPQQTQAPAEYKPSPTKKAQATTMVTKAKTQDNVVYETVYATVNAYETVTDIAYATETVQAYRRHAHARHAHN